MSAGQKPFRWEILWAYFLTALMVGLLVIAAVRLHGDWLPIRDCVQLLAVAVLLGFFSLLLLIRGGTR
jgi:hypothetical protein